MIVLLTRHGETSWNALQKIQGKKDIELNENGIEQANRTKELLKNEKIDLIISSPLKRARETAEIINEGRNIPIIFDEGVEERNFGEFEGINYNSFDFEAFWNYKQNNTYETAESIKDCFNRVYNFLDRIKEEYKDKVILIVAHGGISIPFHCYFEGIPDIDSLYKLGLKNGEIKKYTLDKEER